MAISYEWRIDRIAKKNTGSLQDAVVTVWWERTGTDDTDNVQGTYYGQVTFDVDEIDSDSFTAFDQLTEEQVIGWVQATVVGDYLTLVNKDIQKEITEKQNALTQVADDDLPWADNS